MPDNNNKSVFDTIRENKAKGIEHQSIPTSYSPTLGDSGYVRPEQTIGSYGESKYDDQLTPGYFEGAGDQGKLEYEYLRGERQSNLEKWGVGIGKAVSKLGVRTLNGIISPLYGVGSAVANLDVSKLWDNEISAYTSEVEKGIDEEYGLYSTKAADAAKGFSKMAHVNFWANDVLDGVSYSAAAMASGSVWAKALKSIGTLAMAGKAKVGTLLGEATTIDNATDQVKFVTDLDSKARRLKNGLNNGAVAALGASTEASVEAYNGANEWEKKMVEQLSTNPDGSRRELTQEETDHIKELRKSVGNSQYAINLPIIMASNWVTFGKAMMGSKSVEKLTAKEIGERITREGVDQSYKKATLSGVQKMLDATYGTRKFLGKAIPEGIEEWEQFATGKGTDHYYTKKFYNPESASFAEAMSEGINAAMTEEGLEQFLVGAVSGGIFGNATHVAKEGLKGYKNPYNDAVMNDALDYINSIKGKDAYKETLGMLNRHANISAELDKHLSKSIEAGVAKNKEFEIGNDRSNLLINYVNHMINMGKIEDLREDLESYKHLQPEEFEQVLGLKLDNDQVTGLKETVHGYIQKRLDKINKIEKLSNSIDELHPNLPRNIKDRFMYAAWTIEDARDRANQLNKEINNILTSEADIISQDNDMFDIGETTPEENKYHLWYDVNKGLINNYINLSDEGRKNFQEGLEKAPLTPMNKALMKAKSEDLNKLIDRRKEFANEYKVLTNPGHQAILSALDKKAEEKASDIIAENSNKESAETSIIQEEDDSQSTKGAPIDLNALLAKTSNNIDDDGNPIDDTKQVQSNTTSVSDTEDKKADIERRKEEDRKKILKKDVYVKSVIDDIVSKFKKATGITISSENYGNLSDGVMIEYSGDIYGEDFTKITKRYSDALNVSLTNEQVDLLLNIAREVHNDIVDKEYKTGLKSISFDKYDELHAKYDAELKALEAQQQQQAVEAQQPVEAQQSIEAQKADIERRRPTSYIRDSKDKKSPLETFRNEAKREWDGVSVITGDRMKNLYVGIQLFVEAYPEHKDLLDKFIKKENGTIGITNNNLSFVLNTLKKQGVTTESELGVKINAKYDAELAGLETSAVTQEDEVLDDISNTTVNTDRNNDTVNSETFENTEDTSKSFSTTRVGAVMLKLYEMAGKLWDRNITGEVKSTNTEITFNVNKPDFARVGDTVEFKVTTISEDANKRNLSNIAESRKRIAKDRKFNKELYTLEDEEFSSDVMTANIGIFIKDDLIGYMPLPHHIVYSKEDPLYDYKIEARKKLIEERRAILNTKGQVFSKINVKGAGKLLTKVDKNNKPLLSPIISRDNDLFDGKHLFVYDNGQSLVEFGNNLEAVFTKDIAKVNKALDSFNGVTFTKEDGTGKNRIYKVVQTANGTYRVIPIYTTLLPDSAIDSIVDIIKQFNNYKDTVSQLQDYIFATSVYNDKYKNATNAIKIDDKGKSIFVGTTRFEIDDLKRNITIKQFKDALRTLRHNINGNKINNKLYQDSLVNNNTIQSNAYIDPKSGQFYVQPYIEVATLTEPTTVKDPITLPLKSTTKLENPSEKTTDIDSFNDEEPEGTENIPFSRTKFTGDLSKAHAVLAKKLPGLTIADVKEAAKVKPNVKDSYGMFRNMIIYLFEGATDKTAYHEAFHGVFRNMLSDAERITILKEAASKYNTPTDIELTDLKGLPGNTKLSKKELTELYYEEKLADEFANYLDLKVNRSLGQKILDFFKSILKMFNIFSNRTEGEINTLFDNIYTGKFRESSKLVNRTIDTTKFGSTAYSRITNKIKLSTELERINSITAQYLAKFNAKLASGLSAEDIKEKDIFQDIKNQYLEVFNTENNKPEELQNKTIKTIAAHVYKNFDASTGSSNNFIESVRKNIAKLNIKLVGNLYSTSEDITDGENESQEVQDTKEDLTQGNTNKDYGQEMTSIASIKSATHALKVFLSSIPVLENGVIKTDSYGFTVYHSYDRLYNFLEKHLANEGSMSLKEMVSTLEAASVYRPEYKQILDSLEAISDKKTRDSMKRQFATNFTKQVLNYKLILFQKKNNLYTFSILDPNRKGVRRDLTDKWKNKNLQDSSYSAMDKYRYYNEKESRYEYDIAKLKDLLVTEVRIKDYTFDEFNELTRSIGIDFDTNALKLIFEKDKKDLIKNIGDYLVGITNNNIIAQSKAVKALVNKSIVSTTELFTSSFNNVENSVVYALQNQSFASRLVNSLSKESSALELIKDLRRDSLYKHNDLLKEIEADQSLYKLFYLDGLKGVIDSAQGKKFNKIHIDDYRAMVINMFLNTASNDNSNKVNTALYAPIVPAEKSLAAIYEAPRYSVALTAAGKIAIDSPMTEKFMNVFKAEASRIQRALLDKKEGVKAIPNYHYNPKSPSDAWDGNAFKFFNLDIGKSSYKKFIEYIDNNLDNVNAIDNMINIDYNLYRYIKEGIVDNLQREFETELSSLTKSGIIAKTEEGYSSKFIISKEPINQIIADYTLNTWLFNINNSMINNGDPAFYKGKNDFGKRFYQSISMTKKIDLSQIDDSFKYLKDKKIKFNVINDIQSSTKSGASIRDMIKGHEDAEAINDILKEHYEKGDIEVTDAQVFVSEGLYKELKRAIGDNSTNFEIIKPFIYGNQWSDELNRYIPVQIKCAILPLTSDYVKNNPLLKGYKDKMDKDPFSAQAIGFKSAFKALTLQGGILQESDEVLDIALESFGYQVDNRDHSVDSKNSSMRQLKMLMYGILENDKTYTVIDGKEVTGREIKDMLMELESANIIESNENLTNLFTNNKKELNELIKESVTKRGATSIIEKIFEVLPNGEFQYELDLTNHAQVIQMISALYSKRAVLQEFRGGAHVQASAIGYKSNDYKNLKEQQENLTPEELKLQSSLEWIKKDPNDPSSIDYIDIAIVAPSKDFYNHINTNGTIKDSLPKELRNMLVYRIPNEGAHSDMVCRIKYILPKQHANTILMPYEVTKQFGSDFDFDKTFFIMKHFSYNKKSKEFRIPSYSKGTLSSSVEKRYEDYARNVIKNNKLAQEVVKAARKDAKEAEYEWYTFGDDIYELVDNKLLKSFEEFSELPIALQNTKEARDNRIIDLYMGSLRSVNMLKSLISPSGPGEISTIYAKVASEQDRGNFFAARAQVALKEVFHSISNLKGAAALHVTGHAWATNGALELANPILVYKDSKVIEYKDLSRVTSDKGEKIVEELSAMMATVMDAAKNPDLLPSVGINDVTLDIWAGLMRLGIGIELATSITSQASIKKYSLAKSNNFRQLKGDTHVNIDINDSINFYSKLYASLYEQVGEDSYIKQRPYYDPEKVNESALLHYDNIVKYTMPIDNTREYTNRNSTESIENRIEYIKTQLEVLNTVKKVESFSKELKDLNTLFSINKEVGPNFEDINQKKIIVSNIQAEDKPLITGKVNLINNKLINSYMSVYDSAFKTINSHFMFASDFFNNIKEQISLKQNNNGNILSIKAKERDLINNITRMFLDASTTFKDLYTGEQEISDEVFISEIGRILYGSKDHNYKFKLFNDMPLSAELKADIRNSAFFANIEMTTLKESGKSYLQLKGNRLELAEKERIINSLLSMYTSPKYKKLAENIVKHSFKITGLYTGLNSYANLIDPEIAVDMGLQSNRKVIKNNLNNGKLPLPFKAEERLIDQIIRNYPQKFTKVFDNNNKNNAKLFTESKEGFITLDPTITNNQRLFEIYTKRTKTTPEEIVDYIRFLDSHKQVKLYKFDRDLYESSEYTTYVYNPISQLGYEGLYVEINPFKDLEKSELPKNNYEAYVKKVKTKDGESKLVDLNKLVKGETKEVEVSNEEQLSTEQGDEETVVDLFAMVSEDDIIYDNTPLNGPIETSELNADTPLNKESIEYLENQSESITFESSFTKEEQSKIIEAYKLKYISFAPNMTSEQVIKAINSELKRDPIKTITKLKECYL